MFLVLFHGPVFEQLMIVVCISLSRFFILFLVCMTQIAVGSLVLSVQRSGDGADELPAPPPLRLEAVRRSSEAQRKKVVNWLSKPASRPSGITTIVLSL